MDVPTYAVLRVTATGAVARSEKPVVPRTKSAASGWPASWSRKPSARHSRRRDSIDGRSVEGPPAGTGGAGIGTAITVRDIGPWDKSRLRRQAWQPRVAMEDPVRRLTHEERTKVERRPKPSETFAGQFREDHGVELPPPARRGPKPLSFSGEGDE